MVVLVTGSSGFVGDNFIKMSPEFTFKEVDLLKHEIADVDFSDTDCVLHLAALVHQMKGAQKDEYFRVNLDLAYKTAICAKEHGVRHFIFMSTSKVYGESSVQNISLNEDSKCNPMEPYAKSKFEAEKLIKALEDVNFKVAIVRSPLVYGAGVRANMFSLVRLIKKYPVLPFGGIENKRSMVYIGNLIALYKKIILSQASGVFIAGDERALSTTELCSLIVRSLNKKVYFFKIPVLFLKILRHTVPAKFDRLFGSMDLDNRKTNEVLGLKLPFTTEEGIKEMIDWYNAEAVS